MNEVTIEKSDILKSGEANPYYLDKDEMWCTWYKCPKCEHTQISTSFNYCPDCGAKITWIK